MTDYVYEELSKLITLLLFKGYITSDDMSEMYRFDKQYEYATHLFKMMKNNVREKE